MDRSEDREERGLRNLREGCNAERSSTLSMHVAEALQRSVGRGLLADPGPGSHDGPVLERNRTTLLLRRMSEGDRDAGDELLALVHDELHALARGYMAGERREHTLQPTALIHEAWIRLAGEGESDWQGRAHFVGVAARAMRRTLIDHARKRGARKRDGAAERLPIEAALELYAEQGPDLLAIGDALDRLEAVDPELVRIVEMRYFAGAGTADIAAALSVSTRTVERGWKTAQSWLRAEIGGADEG